MTQPAASLHSNAELGVARAVLKPRKARPFFGRHPWVLDSAIQRVEGRAADGDVVELIGEHGRWIARGLYNSQSRIRLRLYSWNEEQPLDETFWRDRLATAIGLREQLGYNNPQGGARLVSSEGDGLSGLVVDRYADQLVVQLGSLAMATRLDSLVEMLQQLAAPRGVVVRTDAVTEKYEGQRLRELTAGRRWGDVPEEPVIVEEHGLRYGVELVGGQKTGFYLDQRENRRAAAAYMRGRRVLDVCCYTGGFSLCAAKLGEAREVLGLDSSAPAVAVARAHAELNAIPNAHFRQQEAFAALKELAEQGERFEAVVLDPPKFAGGRQTTAKALAGYARLNRLALDVLTPGGILVTCSCSGHVSREDFLFVLADVAQRSGRNLQILEQRGAAPDHPVSATCLETEYLKCFICRVT